MKKIAFLVFNFILLISIRSFSQSPNNCGKGNDDGTFGLPDTIKFVNPFTGDTIRIPVVAPKDPNEIIGPKGYDSTIKWVSIKENLPYKILFENDPDFTKVPAQKVIIYMPIHPKLNPNSIRIGDFGFGNLTFTVPPNTTAYTQRLDVRDSLGVLLDVTAGLDITNRRAFWVFQSIDPTTGLASTLPVNSGFLPVNDSTKGNGEGYVTLTIQPIANAKTRDSISATADIIFDINEPLATNIESNVIDAVAPVSKVNVASYFVDTVFTVNWAGKDDSLGVGVKSYALYYSKDNGPFILYSDNIDSNSVVFTGQKGASYSFYTLASDYTGNKEAAKSIGDDTIRIAENISITHYFRSKQNGNWNSLLTWESSADSLTWATASVTPLYASKHITIQGKHTVTVTENVITDRTIVEPGGTLSVAEGKTLTVLNNGLTLRSNADSTAKIGESGGYIAGNVIVEQFVPARRSWRLITAPFDSTQSIHTAWQENGLNLPGLGTHITGGSVANGFDQSPTNSSSIKRYNRSANTFDPLTSTLLPLTGQPGYMLFVRGDRTTNLSQGTAAPVTNTILRATGTLRMGTQPTVTVPATGFTLIGNPYASAIDFTKISKPNVLARFYVWDPKRATVGAYVLFDSADGYIPMTSDGSYTGANTIIQSGQAFFIEGNGIAAGTLGIAENNKSLTQRNAFRTNDGNDEKLQVNLRFLNADNTNIIADAASTKYNNLYSTNITSEDAGKLDNIDENVAIIRDGRKLMVERRPLIDIADTMFMKVYNMKQKSYQFEFIPNHFTAPALSAYLEDSYLHTSTPVSLAVTTLVNFSIAADTASANSNRFKIIFKTSGTLPLNFTTVNAYEKNAGIQVDWKVESEMNTRLYEVEKSANGEQFTKVGSVAATGNNNTAVDYGWFDGSPFNGNNFYRIKALENSGGIKYSQIVRVRIGNTKSSIVLYPNPVRDRTLYVQLNNEPKGTYTIQLFNSVGQQVYQQTMEHNGGSATQTLKLNRIVSKGIYQFHIINGENKVIRPIIFD